MKMNTFLDNKTFNGQYLEDIVEPKNPIISLTTYADQILRRKKDHKKVLRQLLSDLGLPGALVVERNKNQNDFTAGIKDLSVTVNGSLSSQFYVSGSTRREATLNLIQRLLHPTENNTPIHDDSHVVFTIKDGKTEREVTVVPVPNKISLVEGYTYRKYEKPRKPNPLKLKKHKRPVELS